MSTMLTRADLRTQYVRDPFVIEAIDVDRLIQELAEGSPNSDPTLWIGRAPFTDYDHLVLASDRRTERCLGILGVQDGATERDEEFLFISTAFVAECARGQGLMRRMVALTLLRAAGNGTTPRIIAAPTCSGLFYRALHGVTRDLPGVVMYPDPEPRPVHLSVAGLAQRIARRVSPGVRFEAGTGALRGGLFASGGAGIAPALSLDPQIDALFGRTLAPPDLILALLDLRRVSEEAVIEKARRIYRRA